MYALKIVSTRDNTKNSLNTAQILASKDIGQVYCLRSSDHDGFKDNLGDRSLSSALGPIQTQTDLSWS